MLSMKPKIRLFVDHILQNGQVVPLTREQAHYLFCVMRLSQGDHIALFNGYNGEWRAIIDQAQKKKGQLLCLEQTEIQMNPPDLWLIFAPVKKARTDFIVEKAVELGAAKILPVKTKFTNSERIRQDRLQAHATEATEQCGGTFVPKVGKLIRLYKLLADWPQERQLLFCDETKTGQSTTLAARQGGKWAILIGPEGGFSQNEREYIATMKNSHSISLGPRILRADTAAVAALTLWQSRLGDWS